MLACIRSGSHVYAVQLNTYDRAYHDVYMFNYSYVNVCQHMHAGIDADGGIVLGAAVGATVEMVAKAKAGMYVCFA